MMTNHVLIVTAEQVDAEVLQDLLRQARDGPFSVEWVTQLSAALERLGDDGRVDVILVDLSLPDSQGIATFDQLFAKAPHTPIMMLSSAEGEDLAAQAIKRGAQGYILKGYFGSSLVSQSLRNIIQRRVVEESLFVEKSRAELTLNSINDAVISTDITGRIDYLNVAAENITGWLREEAHGRLIGEVMPIINGITREPQQNPVERVLKQDKPMMLTAGTILIRHDGIEAVIEDSASPIHDSSGRIVGAVIVFHDITAVKEISVKMAHMVQHDFLTNLPNRMLLNDRITQAIYQAQRRGTHLGVLFLDLDNFKCINDSLGHQVGDKLLQSVALRLLASVRNSDTVCRLGGDEFVVLVTQENAAEKVALTAEKILSALIAPHFIDKLELLVSASIGISVYPLDGRNAETLIKNADTAMYHAKETGRNNFQFFTPDMNVRAVERQVIETHLRIALTRLEFELYYQPKINLESGKITGAEALLRWNHPEWGVVLPGRFVPIAEACGLIVPIGRWVLREACEQVRRWQNAGLKPVPIAVNISSLEFRDKNFLEGVRTILQETAIEPDRIQMEITESVLMRDGESSITILHQLKDMGIQIAVDDFGTGYSSLSYLNRFPIDVLKIDDSFVQEIGTRDGEGIIASAIIAMGSSLKQRVIAEGVEQTCQLSFLKIQNCEEGQGFLFSHPLVAWEFAALLANETRIGGMCESVQSLLPQTGINQLRH